MAGKARSLRYAAMVMAGGIAIGLSGCSTPAPQYVAPEGPAPSATPSVTVQAANVAPAAGHWLSGASGGSAAEGKFGKWRGRPIDIGGTWENGNDEQLAMTSICPGGQWARWAKPLDLAVGAIDAKRGETWAAAAKGAYDARWRRSLLKMKSCWGKRNAANLYLRFAHELNLGSMPWHVKGGQEGNFVKAITRYSDLRYQILPKANIVLCPSDGTSADLKVDIQKLWPGKDPAGRMVANVYGIDTYNGYYVVHNVAEFNAKLLQRANEQPLGMELHRELAEQWGVPFAICEWSNNGDKNDAGKGGEAPEYVKLMNSWFRDHSGDPKRPKAGQLLYEVQFNLLNQFQFLPTKLQPQTAAAYRTQIWGH